MPAINLVKIPFIRKRKRKESLDTVVTYLNSLVAFAGGIGLFQSWRHTSICYTQFDQAIDYCFVRISALRHPFEFISVVKCEGIKLFNNRKNSHLWDTYFCFLLNAIEGWVQCKHVFLYEERRSIFFSQYYSCFIFSILSSV